MALSAASDVSFSPTTINFFGFFADMISSITQSSEDILEYFEKFDGNYDDLDIDDNKV